MGANLILVLVAVSLGITGALAFITLAPNRFRQMITEFFYTLIIPFRHISPACRRLTDNFRERSGSVLNSAGIGQPIILKAAGTVLATAVAVVSVVVELELLVLTFSALGLGGSDDASLPAFLQLLNASTATAIALVASEALWGIVLLDALGLTNLLPLDIHSRKWIFVTVAAILILAGLYMVVLMAEVRSEALSASPASGMMNATTTYDGPEADVYYRIYAVTGTMVLMSALLGLSLLPATLTVLGVILYALLALLALVVAYCCGLLDAFISGLWTFCLAGFSWATGLFNGPASWLRAKLAVDDTISVGTTPPVFTQESAAEASRQSNQSIPPVPPQPPIPEAVVATEVPVNPAVNDESRWNPLSEVGGLREWDI
jgi:hypothetical protein